MTIIQRTNPNRLPRSRGAAFQCCVCERKHDTWTKAKTCAETDVRLGRRVVVRQPVPVDINNPPCEETR